MGVSIYYDARRPTPLAPAEQSAVEPVVGRYTLAELVARPGFVADEFDGEDFCVYDWHRPTEPGVLFEGATKLPLYSEDAFWAAVQHSCALLSEVRRLVANAQWEASVNHHPLRWDEATRVFDPAGWDSGFVKSAY